MSFIVQISPFVHLLTLKIVFRLGALSLVSSTYANILKYHIQGMPNKHYITGVYIAINDIYR
jgi:hypothetical protein